MRCSVVPLSLSDNGRRLRPIYLHDSLKLSLIMYGIALLLHILSATIWTGGHLVLSLVILPGAIRRKSPADLLQFEAAYERLGIPALLIQAVSGLWLAHNLVPDALRWFTFNDSISGLIGIKLGMLFLTAAIAADARLRIIPRLSSDNLWPLARRVIPVTLLSVMYVVVGVSFRTGWLS